MACYYWDDQIELHEIETIEDACMILRQNNPNVRGLKLSPKDATLLAEAGAEALAQALRENNTIVELHMEQIQVTHIKSLIRIGQSIQFHPKIQRFRTSDCRFSDAGAGVITQLATNLRGLWLETDGIGGYGDFLGHVRLAKIAQLEVLSLCDNLVYDEGCRQIMNGLADNSSLVELNLSCNYITSVGASYISDWMMHHDSIRFLHLSWNCIEDEGALHLAKALEGNKTLDVLGLRGNNLGDTGAVALGDAIKSHPSLEILMLEDNKIQEAGSVAIAQAYQNNETITTLELSRNEIGEIGVRAICGGMVNTWYLFLANCNLGDVGATILAEALRQNRTLLEVNIKKNNIGYFGALSISHALAENSTLELINLKGNLITDDGAKALRTIVEEENMTLRRLELDSVYAQHQVAIDVFTTMNAVGRQMILKSSDLIWQHALAKVSSDADLLYMFLKEKPEAFQYRR